MNGFSGPTTAASGPGSLEARFLAVISHELRTPLTTIASLTESLDTDDLVSAERSLAVSAVRRNTERMLRLVDDLTVVSRLQSGELPLSPTPVPIGPLIRQVADDLQITAALTAEDGPPPLTDGPLLRELLYAVIGTVAGGSADRSVAVRAVADPSHWTVTVTAPKSAELTHESLMAGVLALPQPPHRPRSTALWMVFAEAIATRHGGSVALTFDPDVGARAEIRLPLSSPTA